MILLQYRIFNRADERRIDSVTGIPDQESVRLSGSVEAEQAGGSHTVTLENPGGDTNTETIPFKNPDTKDEPAPTEDEPEAPPSENDCDGSVSLEVLGVAISSGLAIVGSAGYMLKRRFGGKDSEEE
jgi:hypothetical protein